jgi:hypothetical protein
MMMLTRCARELRVADEMEFLRAEGKPRTWKIKRGSGNPSQAEGFAVEANRRVEITDANHDVVELVDVKRHGGKRAAGRRNSLRG